MVSAGVFIRRSMKGAVSIPINVSAIPPAAAMAYALWRPAFAVFSFPAPVNCAMVTAAPEESPVKKPTTRATIWAEEPPTLASASFPTNCPTITLSIVL